MTENCIHEALNLKWGDFEDAVQGDDGETPVTPDENGDGGNTNWYTSNPDAGSFTISTAEELAGLALLVNGGNGFDGKTIVLANDISLSAYGSSFNGGKGWAVIGKCGFATDTTFQGQPFMGVFDGNGNTVSGLYINAPDDAYVGLFGLVGEGGEVKNLGVVNANVTGRDRVGAVAGGVSGKITNCYSTGTVRGMGQCNIYGDGNVGGVLGEAWGGAVTGCYSSAAVSGAGKNVGGVAGAVGGGGSIVNSYSAGTVTGDDNRVGGVVGMIQENATADGCYFTGTASGGDNVGGVVGTVFNNSAVSNSYSTGAVSGDDGVGGVAGAVNRNCVLSNSYSSGEVIGLGGGLSIGGIAGVITGSGSIISDCAAFNTDQGIERIAGWTGTGASFINNAAFSASGDTSGDPDSPYGIDITAEEIQADGTIGGRFTSENGWTVVNGKLPGLLGNAVDMPDHLR